jgi:transposase
VPLNERLRLPCADDLARRLLQIETLDRLRVAIALEAPFVRHLYSARHVEPRAATAPLG